MPVYLNAGYFFKSLSRCRPQMSSLLNTTRNQVTYFIIRDAILICMIIIHVQLSCYICNSLNFVENRPAMRLPHTEMPGKIYFLSSEFSNASKGSSG